MESNDYHFLLKDKREELGLTQEKVATLSNISRSYYSDIENGKSFPNGRVLLRINKVLPIFLVANDVNRDFYKER